MARRPDLSDRFVIEAMRGFHFMQAAAPPRSTHFKTDWASRPDTHTDATDGTSASISDVAPETRPALAKTATTNGSMNRHSRRVGNSACEILLYRIRP
jgi:hypothetical protein